MMFHDREWWLALGLVLLAALGGFLGSLIRAFDTKAKVQRVVVVVETGASAFAGVILTLLCNYLELDMRLTGVVVGVGGWVGGRTAMMWLEKRVRRILDGVADQ